MMSNLSYSFLVRFRAPSLEEAENKIKHLDPIEWNIAGISSFPPVRDPGQSHYWRERTWALEERVEMLESALRDCENGVPPIAFA